MFKGQITHDDFVDAIENSPYSYDVTAEHIQITTDLMQKYGIGKMSKPPVAKEWVKTDLLDQAKKALNVGKYIRRITRRWLLPPVQPVNNGTV
jgi:NitT/TauT family transport system substrate-binding protein